MLVIYYSRLNFHTQITADIEAGQFSIYVGINYGKKIDTYYTENAEVAISSVIVLFVLEQCFQTFHIGINIIRKFS